MSVYTLYAKIVYVFFIFVDFDVVYLFNISCIDNQAKSINVTHFSSIYYYILKEHK